MDNETRICAILYADIAKYSSIKGDALVALINKQVRSFSERLKATNGILYSTSTGDGLVVVGSTASIIATEAIAIRDHFRSHDWSRDGFQSPVRMRIGLDLRSVFLTISDGIITDYSGAGMNEAARIEPVVEPNSIWCTNSFKHTLEAEGNAAYAFFPKGEIELAKGAGKKELFELARSSEEPISVSSVGSPQTVVRIPRLKNRITDRDRDELLRSTYKSILNYFETAANELCAQIPEADVSIQRVHDLKFVCTVYVNGKRVNACKIWLNNSSYDAGICFAEGDYSIDGDNSYNERFRVNDDGHELFLTSSSYHNFSMDGENQMSETGASELLWNMFVDHLEN